MTLYIHCLGLYRNILRYIGRSVAARCMYITSVHVAIAFPAAQSSVSRVIQKREKGKIRNKISFLFFQTVYSTPASCFYDLLFHLFLISFFCFSRPSWPFPPFSFPFLLALFFGFSTIIIGKTMGTLAGLWTGQPKKERKEKESISIHPETSRPLYDWLLW